MALGPGVHGAAKGANADQAANPAKRTEAAGSGLPRKARAGLWTHFPRGALNGGVDQESGGC